MLLDLARLNSLPNPFSIIDDEVLAVSFVLMVSGLIMGIWDKRNEISDALAVIVKAGILAGCIAASPWLFSLATDLMYWPAVKLIHANGGVNSAGDNLRAASAAAMAATPLSFSLLHLSTTAIFVVIFTGLCNILAAIGSVILIPLYFLQHGLVHVSQTLLPIGIASLCVPTLREKGMSFILSSLSLLAWPLGFAIVNTIAGSAAHEILVFGPFREYGAIGALLGPLVIGLILILGYVNVPLICYFLFTSGSAYAAQSAVAGMPQSAMTTTIQMARKL
jgi:hypothetical protein